MAPASRSSDAAFNVEETAAAAMRRPVGQVLRRQGTHDRMETDAEAARYVEDYEPYRINDDPGYSDDELARTDWEDENADRTLTGEVPAGIDPRCFGQGEW